MQSLFWQRSLAPLIATARRKIKQLAWKRLKPFGLTPPQFAVLKVVDEAKSAPGCEIAEHICIDAPTTCRIIDTLVKRGFVRVAIDRVDRRKSRIHMTPAGKKVMNRALASMEEIAAEVERGLTRAQMETMREGLMTIIANMDRVVAGEQAPPQKTRRAAARVRSAR